MGAREQSPMKIYKYQLDKTVTVLEMPRGAEILHVGSDPAGHTCVWARFISNNEFILEKRAICIVGTGHEHEADLKYLGTFIQGPFVWHAFESPL